MNLYIHFQDGYTTNLSMYPHYQNPLYQLEETIRKATIQETSSLTWKKRGQCLGYILQVLGFLLVALPIFLLNTMAKLLKELITPLPQPPLLHDLSSKKPYIQAAYEAGIICKILISIPVYLLAIPTLCISPESLLSLCAYAP